MNRHRILLPFFFWGIISCRQQAAPAAGGDGKGVKDSVRTILNRYFDDIRNEGLVAEFRYLDSSDAFFWVPPGFSSALSFDSVRTIIQSNDTVLQHVDNSWTSLRISPHSDQLAGYTGTIKSRITDRQGKITEVNLIETGLLIKRKDGWKLLNGQTAVLP